MAADALAHPDHPGPCRPGQSYQAVIDALDATLGSTVYFSTKPPRSGMRLMAVGRGDGVAVMWDFIPSVGAAVMEMLQGDYRIKRVQNGPYTEGK